MLTYRAASILEEEPLYPVTVNGVEFTVSDIKALLVSIHNRSVSRIVSERCNIDDDEIKRDEYGRVTDEECRDINPGTFFISVTNMVGINRESLVEDRSAGCQVWNQPILRYKILKAKEITENMAVRKLGRKGEDYNRTFGSPDAVRWFYVKMKVSYVTESKSTDEGPLADRIRRYKRSDKYKMILEVDSSDMIIGGEWVGDSRYNHPDFIWLPIKAAGGNPYISMD